MCTQGLRDIRGRKKRKPKSLAFLGFQSNVIDNDDGKDSSYKNLDNLYSIGSSNDDDGTSGQRYLEFRESNMSNLKFVDGIRFSNTTRSRQPLMDIL